MFLSVIPTSYLGFMIAFGIISNSNAFTIPKRGNTFYPYQTPLSLSKDSDSEWISLIDEPNNPHPPVKKQIITPGPDKDSTPPTSSKVTISYVTTLASRDDIEWNEYDVVNSFLKEQQGLYELLQSKFIENEITAAKMFDMDHFFTDDFIQTELGIQNKIQGKKLAMAVRRLKNTREENVDMSRVLDSKDEFSFILGEGKVLKAMETLVSGMTKGEKAKMICRADYGYGKEGLRRRDGDEIIPSFADLCFEIELLDFE